MKIAGNECDFSDYCGQNHASQQDLIMIARFVQVILMFLQFLVELLNHDCTVITEAKENSRKSGCDGTSTKLVGVANLFVMKKEMTLLANRNGNFYFKHGNK